MSSQVFMVGVVQVMVLQALIPCRMMSFFPRISEELASSTKLGGGDMSVM